MKQNILGKARRIAIEAGYHDVKARGEWNGYEVVEPIYTDEGIRYTGYPQYLLVKGESIRWTQTAEESMGILDMED